MGGDFLVSYPAAGILAACSEKRNIATFAAGELILHVFGVISHFERHLISERTKD